MRNQQYISLFFLFAVLLVVAHSIIPHHHHADSFFTHLRNHYPVSNAGYDDPDTPLHCHAFNDLNLFRETQFDISLLTLPEINCIVPDIILLQSFSGISNRNHITLPNNPHKNHRFIIPGPLRAPPAFS